MSTLKFIDLFAGIGGFHLALSSLGHECVFASEIDDELRQLYLLNFPSMKGKVFGDIRSSKDRVPAHDVLCAGFPCQPFSKSGGQMGTRDETRGTLFHEILDILERIRPRLVLLENVGNFERHDGGRTWRVVRQRLLDLGYEVAGTEHRTSRPSTDWRDVGGADAKGGRNARKRIEQEARGHGLISPHHFGYPHHRERFFVIASLDPLPTPAFPSIDRGARSTLLDIVQRTADIAPEELRETRLKDRQRECVDHWNALVKALPAELELPSFPLWGEEIGARYPYEVRTPWSMTPGELGATFRPPFPKHTRKDVLMASLPRYAREEAVAFRHWKIRFIRQNRAWWRSASPHFPRGWAATLKSFPPSHRKLEWNAKGGERDLWRYVLQFRPSGLRVKRYTSSPALVAMTATQIPILGPQERFITRTEGLRLQGFPDDHKLPQSRDRAFMALGNAVHVSVVELLVRHVLEAKGHAAVKPPRAVLA